MQHQHDQVACSTIGYPWTSGYPSRSLPTVSRTQLTINRTSRATYSNVDKFPHSYINRILLRVSRILFFIEKMILLLFPCRYLSMRLGIRDYKMHFESVYIDASQISFLSLYSNMMLVTLHLDTQLTLNS